MISNPGRHLRVERADTSCNDGNPCTADECDPVLGCINTPLTGDPCDDQDPCTTGDRCVDGACLGGDNICACASDVDCAAFEDGDLCNGTLVCVDDGCVLDPETVVECPASSMCVEIACDPGIGECVETALNDGLPCDDGDLCTAGDSCIDGACEGGLFLYCNDGDPCTGDECDPAAGCVSTPLSGVSCNDGDLCTLTGVCVGGQCVGTDPKDCDDGNECTADICTNGSCGHVRVDEEGLKDPGCCADDEDCFDGDECTTDICVGEPGAGVCLNPPLPVLEDDFDDGDSEGWSINNESEGGVTWFVSNQNANSPFFSLEASNPNSDIVLGSGSTKANSPPFAMNPSGSGPLKVEYYRTLLKQGSGMYSDMSLTVSWQYRTADGGYWETGGALETVSNNSSWKKKATITPSGAVFQVRIRFTFEYSCWEPLGCNFSANIDDFRLGWDGCM